MEEKESEGIVDGRKNKGHRKNGPTRKNGDEAVT
jgi:hypothetical protein